MPQTNTLVTLGSAALNLITIGYFMYPRLSVGGAFFVRYSLLWRPFSKPEFWFLENFITVEVL